MNSRALQHSLDRGRRPRLNGREGEKNCLAKNPRNPLISLVSDKKSKEIQENPRLLSAAFAAKRPHAKKTQISPTSLAAAREGVNSADLTYKMRL